MIYKGFYGKFEKIYTLEGNLDIFNCYWNMFHGDQIIAKYVVRDLIAQNNQLTYNSIATLEFGHILMAKIKNRVKDIKVFL